MKIISLLPVKNEAWILPFTLANLWSFSDYIIVADQASDDGSREICARFPKVKVISNNEEGHSNKVRWQLLDEARKIPGNNLLVCIDADEMISPKAIEYIKMMAVEKMEQNSDSVSFEFPWTQLWKSLEEYRVDGVWENNYKAIAFLDDRKVDYQRSFVLNDHTARIPKTEKLMRVDDYPLLHFQYVDWQKNELKQAWYRCNELIAGKTDESKKKGARAINHTYSVTLDTPEVELLPVEKKWFVDIPEVTIPESQVKDSWHYKEIVSGFDKYGIEFFEPLQIWHIPELKKIFVKRVKREPKTKVYPKWLVKLNQFKRNF